MNFFNTILLLAELGSKIGNIEIDKKIQFDIKGFKQKNNLSFVKDIPNFDNIKNYILVNGNKMFIGTILKRPLDNLVQEYTQIDVEFHYAIVMGTTTDGKEILIEMTKGRDVNLITKKDFLVGKFHEQQIEIYSLPPKNITTEKIIERAKEFQFDNYDLLDLNCKVFVENVIWNIPTPNRKAEVKKFQIQLCDLKIGIYKLQLSSPDNEDYYDILKRQLEEAEADKARLAKSIGELLPLN